MTLSTAELVRAFLTTGGKVDHIPRGVCGDVVWKGWLRTGDAHSRSMREARRAKVDAMMRGQEPGNIALNNHPAVDVFIKLRNAKGI